MAIDWINETWRMPEMPEVVWWNGQRGSWCQAICEWLCEGMTHRMRIEELRGDGAIVVIKADQLTDINALSSDLATLRWKLLIVTANEEGNVRFAVDDPFRSISIQDKGLVEINCRIWLQTPHRHQTADTYLPWGWTPGCSVEVQAKKTLDWSFAGQITHPRREDFWAVAHETMKNRVIMYADDATRMIGDRCEIIGSKGFSRGIGQEEYYRLMAASKVIPCPSGPITVDSMRVCESLNLGAVPCIDTRSPTGEYSKYWKRVFGEDMPLFTVVEWSEFPEQLEYVLANWHDLANEIIPWWRIYKQELRQKLYADIEELKGATR